MTHGERPAGLTACLVALALRALVASWRVDVRVDEGAAAILDAGGPCLVAHWHDSIPGLLAVARRWPVAAVLSTSRDGERVAPLLAGLGITAVRGSSGSASRGARLYFAARRFLAQGGALAVALDGSRGPRRQAKAGVFALSDAGGAPVLSAVAVCPWAWTLRRSWDRARIPLPGARVQIWIGAPVPAVGTSRERVVGLQSRLAAMEAELLGPVGSAAP